MKNRQQNLKSAQHDDLTDVDVRYCNCADPENCREPIPEYACRPRPASSPVHGEPSRTDAEWEEAHVVTEPVDDVAHARAKGLILDSLAEWLFEERQKVMPTSERWKALADATQEMHRLWMVEMPPPPALADLRTRG